MLAWIKRKIAASKKLKDEKFGPWERIGYGTRSNSSNLHYFNKRVNRMGASEYQLEDKRLWTGGKTPTFRFEDGFNPTEQDIAEGKKLFFDPAPDSPPGPTWYYQA